MIDWYVVFAPVLLLAVVALVRFIGCNGTFTIGPTPDPTITSLTPNSTTAGGPTFDLIIHGTGFIEGFSTVRFGSVVYTRQDISYSPLTMRIRIHAAYIDDAQQITVTVITGPAPVTGGGGTATATFTINNPLPDVASVTTNLPAPYLNSAPAGGTAFRLMVNGNRFVPGSLVQWDGVARVTNLVSPNQLTIDVPAADIATAKIVQIGVRNPPPGGGPAPITVPFPIHPVLTVITLVELLPVLLYATRVTFDNPAPPATTPNPLNGVYPPPPAPPRLDFGVGQWQWAEEFVGAVRYRNIFFNTGGTPPYRFSFANGSRVLLSVEARTVTDGDITLRDNNGRMVSQRITVAGGTHTVATGWVDQPSADITVQFTAGRDLGITAITYLGLP